MRHYDYIFFDVANTLLFKKELFSKLISVFESYGIDIEEKELRRNHKMLSEVIKFPDKTSKDFYDFFNSELCMSLGVIPNEKILRDIFSNCSYLKWQTYPDVDAIKEIAGKKGIISNWDKSLPEKLKKYVDVEFDYVFCSEELGVSKPDPRIFELVEQKVNSSNILYIGDSIKLDMIEPLKRGWEVRLIDRDNHYKIFPYQIKSLKDLI